MSFLKGTKVLAVPACPHPSFPSPRLERGGRSKASEVAYRRIESLARGDLVMGHRGRPCTVMSVSHRQHRGRLVGLRRRGCCDTLWLTPESLVATPLPALPAFEADTDTARRLRRNSTLSEATLWQALRERGTARKFRRQHPMGPFVLDFFCPALRLAVEIDGGIHAAPNRADYDRFRQQLIEGYHVLLVRLRSDELEDRLSDAVTKITVAAARRATQVSYDLGWVAAGDLSVGDPILFGRSRKEARIVETTAEVRDTSVCDLLIDQDESCITEVCILRAVGASPASRFRPSTCPLSSLGEGTKG